MNNPSVIVPSMFNINEFYVFRGCGEEIKCTINTKKILRSFNQSLTKLEVELIGTIYSFIKHIKKPL